MYLFPYYSSSLGLHLRSATHCEGITVKGRGEILVSLVPLIFCFCRNYQSLKYLCYVCEMPVYISLLWRTWIY